MLRALRCSLGVPASLLVVLLTMGAALPAALHGDANDDACDAAAASATAGLHLQTDSSVTAAQHCGICHWLRSLRVFEPGASQPLPRLVRSTAVVAHAGCTARRLVIDPAPARAPPA
jgi:hypothetical protein